MCVSTKNYLINTLTRFCASMLTLADVSNEFTSRIYPTVYRARLEVKDRIVLKKVIMVYLLFIKSSSRSYRKVQSGLLTNRKRNYTSSKHDDTVSTFIIVTANPLFIKTCF